MLVLKSDVQNAFRALDPFRVAELDLKPEDDFRRAVLAWEALSRGEIGEADTLLAALTGDGTLHPADLAFVQAFRYEQDGEFQRIVDTLTAQFGQLEGSIQGFRLYLRAADALLKLREFAKVQQVLDPLLQPPGRTGTLEAMFIVLQGMMATGAEKDRLIEHVALIDGLLEKGFRLTESDNVIFYATWLEQHRIEPPIAPLLNSHAGMVEAFRTENRELITSLLVMGDRHKAPSAVRCAGRNYARKPFPFEGIDVERATYLFSSHEEHDAARQAVLMGFPRSRINKQQNLWGPLFLSSYYAGKWKEVLDIYRDHREELPRMKFHDNARSIKAVCEFQLRRLPEALRTMDELGLKFYDHTTGSEAAAHFLTVLALRSVEAAIEVAAKSFTIKKENSEWVNEYATTILTQLAVHDRVAGLDAWIHFLGEVLRREVRAETLQRVGDMMVEWALPHNAETVATELEKLGEKQRAVLLRAFVACEKGDAAAMEEGFAATAALTGRETPEFLLLRGRCRRRLGLFDLAKADVEALLADEKFLRRHAAFGLKEGLLRQAGAPSQQAEDARANGLAHIRTAARNADESSIMTYEMNQLASGETAYAYLLLGRDAEQRDPDSIEVLRLYRKAARSAIAEDYVREEAKRLQARWEDTNLLLPRVV
ncbi:hypothetical protein GC173_00300 [bacterium]|nr:hypothetical protein [bacterium]